MAVCPSGAKTPRELLPEKELLSGPVHFIYTYLILIILFPFAVHKELGFHLKLTDMKTQVNRYEDTS